MDPLLMSGLFGIGKGLLGGVGSYLTSKSDGGTKNKIKKLPNYDPFQQKIHEMMGKNLKGGGYEDALDILRQYLDPESDIYSNFEAPYRQEFEEETIPALAERFAGMGSNSGALSSSAFGQALGSAGSGLQTKLAALKAAMQREATGDIFGQYQQYLQHSPFDYIAHQKQKKASGGSSFLSGFLKSIF